MSWSGIPNTVYFARPKPDRWVIKGRISQVAAVKSDIEIARAAHLLPIRSIGEKLGIPEDAMLSYGPTKAKLSHDFVASLTERQTAN